MKNNQKQGLKNGPAQYIEKNGLFFFQTAFLICKIILQYIFVLAYSNSSSKVDIMPVSLMDN